MLKKWVIVLVFLAVSAEKGYADTAAVPVISVYDSAVCMLIHQQYGAAQNLLSTTLRNNPSDLRSLYLSFAIEQTRILDYESYLTEHKQFQSFADSLKPVFEKRIASLRGRDSTECLFYIANIYGGTSLMQLKTGNWFDGAKNAFTLVSMLKQVKKRAPDFYAADLGLGAFNYYLSTGFKWLPFVESNEREGLDAMELALKADPPYNYGAKNSLCWILIERKEFKRADSIVQSVLNEYPENTIFLRIKALIALWTGNYAGARQMGNRLIQLSEKRLPVNWSDLVAGYMVIVRSAAEQGDDKAAGKSAREILNRGVPKAYLDVPHVKKNIKLIKDTDRKYKREK
jgi:hypothetical protein